MKTCHIYCLQSWYFTKFPPLPPSHGNPSRAKIIAFTGILEFSQPFIFVLSAKIVHTHHQWNNSPFDLNLAEVELQGKGFGHHFVESAFSCGLNTLQFDVQVFWILRVGFQVPGEACYGWIVNHGICPYCLWWCPFIIRSFLAPSIGRRGSIPTSFSRSINFRKSRRQEHMEGLEVW